MQFAAFGLMWRCVDGRATWGEIALPSSDVPVGAGEVVIEAGSLRSSDADWLPGLSYPERGQAVFSVPGIAQFFIRHNAITVHKLEGADPQAVQAYLLGSAVGAVLHMRGVLPLHGSAVRQPDGGAAVFCGESGAGKSTTLTALAQRGVPCVADDVSAIQFDEQGQAWVSVRYEGRDQPALKEISVHFPARTTTAIMGPSGAGKSTLADVLMGLLDPDEGELEVDGVPIVGEMRMAWRRSVAYVPQEVFLFHDSIRNNLLWAAPDASEAALHLALQQSAADFVFELPQGLDTQVGDGGVRLSGGECQRIAIARTLLQRPSLLILDEATSSLDMENEARVRQAIENLHGDLTVVIIGHRLPTLEHADLVVVLAQGCIAQQGRWAEMKANSSQKSGQLDHC